MQGEPRGRLKNKETVTARERSPEGISDEAIRKTRIEDCFFAQLIAMTVPFSSLLS
jgi:hypothetical protein